MEKSKSSIIGKVWFLITEVPFSNHAGMIPCLIHKLRKGGTGRIEIAPVGFRVLTDNSGGTHQIGIAASHQGCPGGRAYRAVRIELIHPHAGIHQFINCWGPDVFSAK